MMTDQEVHTREYRPAPVSRKNELVSWGVAFLLISSVVLTSMQGQAVPLAITVLTVFVGLAAVVISFGNWMERKTILVVATGHIHYQNGVRRATLAWDQIQQILVDEDRLSKKVTIIGEQAHFRFRLLSEPRYKGEVRGQFGFEEGDEIMRIITERSGQQPTQSEEDKT